MTFDLEMARTDWNQIRGRTFTGDFSFFRVIQNVPCMLAEIERLRAENAGLSKAVIDIQEEQAARIKDLEAEIKKAEARISELEDMVDWGPEPTYGGEVL